MSNTPFIEARKLCFHYDDEDDEQPKSAEPIPVLKELDLTVHRGEYLAVLGHNGSGKSTFAKLLNIGVTQHYGVVEGDYIAELRDFAKIMDMEFTYLNE